MNDNQYVNYNPVPQPALQPVMEPPKNNKTGYIILIILLIISIGAAGYFYKKSTELNKKSSSVEIEGINTKFLKDPEKDNMKESIQRNTYCNNSHCNSNCKGDTCVCVSFSEDETYLVKCKKLNSQ